jgi:hypothetical protein
LQSLEPDQFTLNPKNNCHSGASRNLAAISILNEIP